MTAPPFAQWMPVVVSPGMCCLFVDTDAGSHRTKFVDLKAHPERTDELPEVKMHPKLGDFLREINGCKAVRSVGCGCNALAPSNNRAHFVDIGLYDPLAEHSPRAVCYLRDILETKLSQTIHDRSVSVEIAFSTAFLPGDEQLLSLRLFLHGTSPAARPAIVAALREQKIEDYIRIAEEEMAGWSQKAKQIREGRKT